MSSHFTILNQPPLPCDTCTGECCTAIPLTARQFKLVAKTLKTLPAEQLDRLIHQPRNINQCMLLDQKTYRCSVYEARPTLCRIFGRHPGGVCTHAPERSRDLTEHQAHVQMVGDFVGDHKVVGLTGLTTYDAPSNITDYVLRWGDFQTEMEKP